MRHLSIALLIIISFCSSSWGNELRPYQKGEWSKLVASNPDRPLVIHFWGVTCAPCVKEMPVWGKFTKENKKLNIAYVQVDNVPPEQISKMLIKANLGSANNYYLIGPFDEFLRFEIHSKWRGETPMTILIDKQNRQILKIGTMDFEWLKKQIGH
ncbi:TlpA family protein disulfide reductase [Polynucleobacter sp. MWH-UH24A]|uniref:TlpA family protein disulfide reductase n=1 Tax=Polynucleobacter sp. MWH-UH24A TaxID=2689110 RepID=UPI001BFD15D9|nr:TlpA disulfide reductase family protein [Polynucleobacter sp. MWH-UH24A]QWD75910.1 TlpA family protein disulfide reductase [Polynucleobacter sp. MWH-UH24A]